MLIMSGYKECFSRILFFIFRKNLAEKNFVQNMQIDSLNYQKQQRELKRQEKAQKAFLEKCRKDYFEIYDLNKNGKLE